MPSTREQALAALNLPPDADAAAVQRAFERLARRYPQPHFADRFRQLLEARDQLLDSGRLWRERLEGRTLDLAWAFPQLVQAAPGSGPDRRKALQDMLRAGFIAEPVEAGFPKDLPIELPNDIPF